MGEVITGINDDDLFGSISQRRGGAALLSSSSSLLNNFFRFRVLIQEHFH